MKTHRTYVFLFVPIFVDSVANASRVPAMASSPSRTSLDSLGFQQVSTNPKPARETRALPNDLFWKWFVDNPRRNLP